METLSTVLDRLIEWVGLLFPILITAAVAVFFWGLVKFIWHADDEQSVEEGKSVMVWGMLALFVMVALWSIIGFIQGAIFGGATDGVISEGPSIPSDIPMP